MLPPTLDEIAEMEGIQEKIVRWAEGWVSTRLDPDGRRAPAWGAGEPAAGHEAAHVTLAVLGGLDVRFVTIGEDGLGGNSEMGTPLHTIARFAASTEEVRSAAWRKLLATLAPYGLTDELLPPVTDGWWDALAAGERKVPPERRGYDPDHAALEATYLIEIGRSGGVGGLDGPALCERALPFIDAALVAVGELARLPAVLDAHGVLTATLTEHRELEGATAYAVLARAPTYSDFRLVAVPLPPAA